MLSRSRMYMLLAAAMLLISSCASLSGNGVGRVRYYTIESSQLSPAFDGCRVAFVSDIHYPSLFGKERLPKLVACLDRIEPDILLLGGDYVTDNDSIDALFTTLGTVGATLGSYAVLGNHERGNAAQVAEAMERNGIVLLGDTCVRLHSAGSDIYVAGVLDSFGNAGPGIPQAASDEGGFVILLAHTPDYAERVRTDADLVLSGHTHGGQVNLFGLYAPVKNSLYGNRFLSGMNTTSNGTAVITANGVGTSRRKVRFCVPSEMVVVTLVNPDTR